MQAYESATRAAKVFAPARAPKLRCYVAPAYLMAPPNIVVVMGISGSGKSTVGRQLAERLGWPFHDGDDFHPAQNVSKMSKGIPLDDDDRRPWLQTLHDALADILRQGAHAVLAASLLKQAYREVVLGDLPGVRLVYLRADPRVIDERLQKRQGHFFQASLLTTQLEILEEPTDALALSVEAPSAALVAQVIEAFGLVAPVAPLPLHQPS